MIPATKRPVRVPAGLAVLAAAWMIAAASMSAAHAGGEPELITALRAKGAEILSLGSRGGLAGYFVRPAAGGGYGLYLTADGHAVAGLLYAPDGSEITGGQLAAARSAATAAAPGPVPAEATAAVPPAPPSRAALFKRSAEAFGFTLGERGPLAVLFGDPRCPWSRSSVARLGREALDGRLRLHVVPVAILGAASARTAAGIAASPDPARAWFERAGLPPDRTGAGRIARNNALLDEWGAGAVPFMVWRGRDGTIAHRLGDIEDAAAWFREAGLE